MVIAGTGGGEQGRRHTREPDIALNCLGWAIILLYFLQQILSIAVDDSKVLR